MVSLLDMPKTRPSSAMINQLERIGELKGGLGRYQHEVCGALGLQVQLSSLSPDSGMVPGAGKSRPSRGSGFQRLRAVEDSAIRFEAWQEITGVEEWTVVVYEPGEWEARCQPTLRLVQWLHDWGGLHPTMQFTLQTAVENFKTTGELSLPLRRETGGRLCGRCGEEVGNLPEHVRTLHDRPESQMPLSVYIRVRDGAKSVMVAQSKGRQQLMWTVPEELHRPELKDPRFQPGLAEDIDRAASIAGRARSVPKNGKFQLPDDITPLPYLASVLRRLTKGDVLVLG